MKKKNEYEYEIIMKKFMKAGSKYNKTDIEIKI